MPQPTRDIGAPPGAKWDAFAFFVLIIMLVFRPSGLLGERVGERA